MSELPLPYVPISPALKKSKRFEAFVEAANLYDDPFAEFYIHKLLLFAGEARVDGNLGSIPAKKLARECVWQGDPTEFVNALVASGWLVADASGDLHIGGWEKHGGRVLRDRIRWRKTRGIGEVREATDEEVEEVGRVIAELPRVLREARGEVPRGVHEDSARVQVDDHSLKGEPEPEYEPEEEAEEAEEAPSEKTECKAEPPRVPQKPSQTLPSEIATLEQFQDYVSGVGWQAVLSPNQVVVATRVLSTGPIRAQELAYASSITNERAKAQGSRPSVGLFLAIVKGERAKTPTPGSEHEAAERARVERPTPRKVFKPPIEEPSFTRAPDVVADVLAKIGA